VQADLSGGEPTSTPSTQQDETENKAASRVQDLMALDRPVDPVSYLVGPGDELAVNIWGSVNRGFNLVISPEATAILPTVGEISVRGMTLMSAKDAILHRVGQVYPGASATVTLVRVRTLRIAVTGMVETPGLYLATANIRASEAIEMAGWLESSSRRNIIMRRRGDSLRVDEQVFARTADEKFNPYVTEGDIIFVPQMPRAHGLISIQGSVNSPQTFEYVPGDRLNDALRLAFGNSPESDTSAIELYRFLGDDTAATKLLVDLSSTEPGEGRSTPLEPDDRIYVRARREFRPKASVEIVGEVYRPGGYVIENGRTMLSDILERCGGVTHRADVARASLVRGGQFQLDFDIDRRMRSVPGDIQTRTEREWVLAHSLSVPGQMSVDLARLLRGNTDYDLPLWNGDIIYIPRFISQVNVIGRVRRPGLVPFEVGHDLSFYIERAGGLAWRADGKNVFVVKGITGMPVERHKVNEVDAGDTIVIPTKREKRFWPIFRDAMVVMGNIATMYLVIDQAVK